MYLSFYQHIHPSIYISLSFYLFIYLSIRSKNNHLSSYFCYTIHSARVPITLSFFLFLFRLLSNLILMYKLYQVKEVQRKTSPFIGFEPVNTLFTRSLLNFQCIDPKKKNYIFIKLFLPVIKKKKTIKETRVTMMRVIHFLCYCH